jgi:hypothetical protein
MKPDELLIEIFGLEKQLSYHQNLLNNAFSNNLQFGKITIIFHRVKSLSDKLGGLKKLITSI